MISVTTKSGFTAEVNEGIGNDFRVVEAIADADSGDESRMLRGTVDLVRLMLGENGKKALYAHLEAKHGSVPVEAVISEVTEILTLAREQSKAVKN